MSKSLSQKITIGTLLTSLCFISANAISSTTADNSNWSGFYIGSQLSYINASTRWIYPEDTYYTLATGKKQFSPDLQGATPGVNLTWLYQLNSIVMGIKASYEFENLSDTATGPFTPLFPNDTFETTIGQIATVAPLIGYAHKHWMLYAKGGAAVAKETVRAVSAPPGGGVIADASRHQYGWTLGAGVSYQLNSKISIGTEYDFVRINPRHFPITTTGTPTTGSDSQANTNLAHTNMNIVNLNVSYKI